MNYKTLFNAVKTELEKIPELKDRVRIYNSDDTSSGYPFVNISGFAKTRVLSATCLVEETGTIELTLFQEINADNSGKTRGTDVVLDIMSKIDDTLDANRNLSGAVDGLDDIMLTNANTGYADNTLNCKTYIFTLTYNAHKTLTH